MKNIPISNRNGLFAIVDDADFARVSAQKWMLNHDGYVQDTSYGYRLEKRLHRFLVDAPRAMVVDHINGNKLDNRRSNLRVCTKAQNCRNQMFSKKNKSGVRGVHFDKQRARWFAQIVVSQKHIPLGRYKVFEDAVRARKAAEVKFFGEFAGGKCRPDGKDRISV